MAAQMLSPADRQVFLSKIEEMQMKVTVRMYNELVSRCYTECVTGFRAKKMSDKETRCVDRCAEKFMKYSQRVGQRFQEHQAAMEQSGGGFNQ